eukprot:TRINITY_DN29963_c0_g1_i10.p1 TRINITY_DN29963_c0_g1~~TRINITY_DN29963_c0_g1_i10.p1  ORF type:complete len:267 (-),score=31.93 TRINITY_DN29963_c0_g1_i10:521-1321(-)
MLNLTRQSSGHVLLKSFHNPLQKQSSKPKKTPQRNSNQQKILKQYQLKQKSRQTCVTVNQQGWRPKNDDFRNYRDRQSYKNKYEYDDNYRRNKKADFEFKIGQFEFRADREDLNSLILPIAGALFLLSMVGPILALAAGTIVMAGVAVTVGFSSILFLMSIFGFFFLFGGGAFFLGPLLFAGLGIFGLVVKMGIVLGSIALGTSIAQNFLFSPKEKTSVQDQLRSKEDEFDREMEEKQMEIDRELREFDEMMDRRQQSYQDWKRKY